MGGKYGNKRAIAPEQEPEIISAYLKEGNCRSVAKLFGVSDETVRRVLKRNDVPRRRKKADKPKVRTGSNNKGVNRQKVGEMYAAGLSVHEIAVFFGCRDMSIYYHLQKLGLYEIGHVKRRKSKIIDAVERDYLAGASTYELEEKYGVCHETIGKWMRECGHRRGKSQSAPRTVTCARCGNQFTARKVNQIYCSRTCRNAVHFQHRRDLKRISLDENADVITLRKVWERDKGRCYICGCKTDWNDYHMVNGWRVTGPRYPTRDHVIAINNGGTHTWNNVRLACFECNTRKADLGQMRLAI